MSERPDQRFSLLHDVADEAFWDRAWAQCAAALAGTPLLEALEASETNAELRAETYEDRFSESVAVCAHLLYGEVAGLLARHDAATLDYDGHRSYLAGVIETVERTSPTAKGLLVASSDDRGVEEETFEMWRRERLVVRDRPRAATVRRLTDVLRDRQVASFLSSKGGETHIFGSVRPAYRLMEQFGVADTALLASAGSAPVLTLRGLDDDGTVDLTVVEEPYELTGLVKSLPDGMPVHLNLSLACLGDVRWRKRWDRALRRTRLTGLFDLSPMAQLELWARLGEPLSYAQATLRDTDRDHADLIVLVVGRSGLPLLLICTAVTSDVLQQYIDRTYPTARQDRSVITERQADVEVVTSHLLHEEYFFDLAAYPVPASAHDGGTS
jgi:hypothetical protein